MTDFVERLAGKWARIAEQNGCDHEPTVCRERAQDSIRRALHEALTEAARVSRAEICDLKPNMFTPAGLDPMNESHHSDADDWCHAAFVIARQIERLRDA